MSNTSHGHERVRSYLRELDAALRGVPADKARELREQIAAHLDDAIAPDADAEHVAEVLDRLGAPADLAADVARPVLPPSVAFWLTGAWLRQRLAQVLPRTWIVLAVTAVLRGTAASYLIIYAAPSPAAPVPLPAGDLALERLLRGRRGSVVRRSHRAGQGRLVRQYANHSARPGLRHIRRQQPELPRTTTTPCQRGDDEKGYQP